MGVGWAGLVGWAGGVGWMAGSGGALLQGQRGSAAGAKGQGDLPRYRQLQWAYLPHPLLFSLPTSPPLNPPTLSLNLQSLLPACRRSICRGALAALAYCHSRGVVHGSLGSGSVLLSTFSDAEAERLVVKLDNFGFARRILPPGAAAGPEGGALGAGCTG